MINNNITMSALTTDHSNGLALYRQHQLGSTAASSVVNKSGVRALTDIALDALALSFSRNPSIEGLPPDIVAALSARLPADLDPRVTMPHIHDELYWRRACEEGRGWFDVDISLHGHLWKQVRTNSYFYLTL